MKNLYLLSTDKPSRLFLKKNKINKELEEYAERLYSGEDLREALFHALYLPKTDGYIEKTIDEIVRETMSIFKNK